MIRFILAFILLYSGASVAATKTCVLIGDSIMSAVSDGSSNQLALSLVQNERDVIIRNIASPGASLAATDYTGYNSTQILDTLNRIGGMFSAYNCVIIQAGTNDFGRSANWTDTVTSLRRILTHSRAMSKKVMVLDPIWRANEDVLNSAGGNLNTYRYMTYLVCSQEFSDICHFASRLNTPMGTSAGSANYSAAEVAAGTQLHPNVAGHRYLADWIKAEAAAAGLF